MNRYRITNEQVLYLLAIGIGIFIRFVPLGWGSLNGPEAVVALQSLQITRGATIVLSPQPFYLLGTAALDFMFGASTYLARLLPALAGVLLILVPILLRREFGRKTSIILAFLIALDPGLVGTSVQAGSHMIAITLVVLALVGWIRRLPVLAGICAGFALLGGPTVWPGIAALGLAAWVSYSKAGSAAGDTPFDWKKSGIAALAAAVLGGTLLMLVPSGINAAAASLPAYFTGWAGENGTAVLDVLGALIAYEILGIILGLGGIVQGLLKERDGLDLFLAVWWAGSLILTLLYPGRQILDLSWVILPMLVLAARQLSRMLEVASGDRLAVIGQSLLVVLLLLLLINLLISWPNAEPSQGNQIYRWAVLSAAFLLLVAESLLMGWGWSAKIALDGLMWGLTGILVLFSISSAVGGSGVSNRHSMEMWRSGPTFPDADILVATVRDYSQWTSSPSPAPTISIVGAVSPAVQWALRDFPGLRVESSLPSDAQPEMMITTDSVTLDQSAAYTGQAFVVGRAPAWDIILPSEWIDWLVYRNVKADVVQSTNIILWVRTDRFPGAASQSTTP